MTIICLCVLSDSIVSGWRKGVRMTIICLRMSTGSPPLDDKRAQNDHNLSLRAIGHDRLQMAKRCGVTIIFLRMSHDLRVGMTEIVGRPIKARLLLLHILNEELRPT